MSTPSPQHPADQAGAGSPDGFDAEADADAVPGTGRPGLRPVRRRPKFRAFLLTGAVLGLVVAMIIDRTGPDVPNYGAASVIGFIGLLFAGLGALIGGIVAILVDRRD